MTYTCEDDSYPVSGPRKPAMPRVRPRFVGLSRSAVALFRVGTYRARLAAALMIVAGSLLYQTGAQALEQSSKKVLYLDAPSVSVPQAEKAGETARGYAGPDSNVDDSVLAWVDVKPVPLEARKALASITNPSGQPPGGVSYDAAVAAGDAMVAQLGGEPPAPSGGEDDELASADPVRPKLGDGTKATADPEPDGADQQPNTGSSPELVAPESGSQEPEYAAADSPAPSDLGLPAPMAEEYAPEPSTEQPVEQPPDSGGDELAAVGDDASEGTGEGTGGTSATGPISDDYSPEAASPEPSDGSADEAAPQDETESGSSDTGLDPPAGESSPTIIVPDSPASDDEPEQEYAGVPEGAGTEPETSDTETSEPDNTGTPPDEPSSEPSSEPSPASSAEESVPAQDTSPGTDEQEPEESSDLVAVVPYDPGADESQDESQEGLEQSSQPPAELPEEATAEPSSGPSTDETESDSPEPAPGQQGEFPEQAAATPPPAEEPTGEGPAVQPEAGPDAELGAGEDTEDPATDDELPEGVQIESSDEDGVQKLSVVVHQESDATDIQAGDSPGVRATPESAPPEPSESEQSSPASQEEEDHPSNGHGQNPNAQPAPRPDNAELPGWDQPSETPGNRSGDHTGRGNNPSGDSPAPQEAPGEQQQPAPEVSPEPSAGTDQVQPETTPEPTAGNEANEPETAPVDQGRQGHQRPDQERVSKQEPRTSTPTPAPSPKDQTPRRSADRPNGQPPAQSDNPSPNAQPDTVEGQPPLAELYPGQNHGRPEFTSDQSSGDGSNEPPGPPIQQGRQDERGNPQEDQKRLSGQQSQTSTPVPKDQAPRSNVEGTDQGAQSNEQVQDPTQSRDAKGKQQLPQQERQQPSQPAREPRQAPRQSTAPAEVSPEKVSTGEQGDGTRAQGPTQSADAMQISAQTAPPAEPTAEPQTQPQARPRVEPVPAQDSESPTPTATPNEQQSNQAAPAPQVAAGQATPEVAPQTAPAIQTSVEPATEEIADPAGWVHPTQAAAARQANQAVSQPASQGVQPVDTAAQGYTEPAVEQGWDQAAPQVTDTYAAQEAVGTASETLTPPEGIAEPYVEPSTTPAAGSYEAPAVQDATGYVEDVTQDAYTQEAADPYVEGVAADATPAPQPETYEAPAPAETYTEPVTQVPAQQLEPVQQVQTQELEPAPQVANAIESEPAAAPPSAAPTDVDAGVASPAPAQQAQQQVASTVGTVIQQTNSAGGVAGGGK